MKEGVLIVVPMSLSPMIWQLPFSLRFLHSLLTRGKRREWKRRWNLLLCSAYIYIRMYIYIYTYLYTYIYIYRGFGVEGSECRARGLR